MLKNILSKNPVELQKNIMNYSLGSIYLYVSINLFK